MENEISLSKLATQIEGNFKEKILISIIVKNKMELKIFCKDTAKNNGKVFYISNLPILEFGWKIFTN